MTILTCHTPGALRPETAAAVRDALIAHRPNLSWKLGVITEGDSGEYGRILQEEWRGGEGFAVVEPDIVIRDDVAAGFLDCPAPYCAWPYAWLTDVGPALGCTRFRAEFTRAYPDVMDRVVATGVGWQQVDVVLMRHVLARDLGFQPHVHLPPVEHLNEAKALLPEASREPLMQVPHW